MTTLFGRDFEERVALQRRRIYHQRLLEAQSFKFEPHTYDDIPAGAKAEFPGYSSDSDDAALPAGALLMLTTKWLSGDWGPGFGRAFTTSFIGIFSYLAVTVVIGFCVNLFHEPVAHPRFGSQLAGAIVELRV